jgi:hypothetical protein
LQQPLARHGHRIDAVTVGRCLSDLNYETVVNLIGATKTRTGLRVKAVLDTGTYHKGVKVEDEAMRDIRLRRHKLHPEWNYTIDHRSS